MDRLKKAALLTRLIEALRSEANWTGETHIQKAVYLLQELLQVRFGFQFVLYWYGPFSFDLRNELTALRGDELIRIEPQAVPYGPRFAVTDQAKYIQSLYPKTLDEYEARIQFLATELGAKDVSALEKVAIGYYIGQKLPQASPDERAKELGKIKPHVTEECAVNAIAEVNTIISHARHLVA